MYDESTINKFKEIQELMLYPQWKVFKEYMATILGDILRQCGSATKETIDELRGKRIIAEDIYRLDATIRSILDKFSKEADNAKT